MNTVCVKECVNVASYENDAELFLSYLRMKGRRPATIDTYRKALRSVFRTMLSIGMSMDVSCLTDDDMIALRDAMTVCENSKKLYLLVLGRMIETLYGRNPYKTADILWNHQTPKRLFIRPDDLRMMLSVADERERLVLMLGAYMGLRRKEIADVRLSDIRGNSLVVRGKGHGPEGKVEHLTIPRPVMTAISEYMAVRNSQCEHLLLNTDGSDRISYGGVAGIVHRLSRMNGISMTPHSLRRLFATTLFECGVDLNTIRQLTRHEDISTLVECYIDVNPVRKENALNLLCGALA